MVFGYQMVHDNDSQWGISWLCRAFVLGDEDAYYKMNKIEKISALRSKIDHLEKENARLMERNDLLEKANRELQDKIKEMLADLRE